MLDHQNCFPLLSLLAIPATLSSLAWIYLWAIGVEEIYVVNEKEVVIGTGVVKIRELADDSGVINTLPGQTSSTMSKV